MHFKENYTVYKKRFTYTSFTELLQKKHVIVNNTELLL